MLLFSFSPNPPEMKPSGCGLNADLQLWSCGLLASGASGLWCRSTLQLTQPLTTIQLVVTEGGNTNVELKPIIPSYKLFYSMLIKWLPVEQFSHRSVTWISRFEQIRLSFQEMELVRHYSQGQRQEQSARSFWSPLHFHFQAVDALIPRSLLALCAMWEHDGMFVC